MSERSQSAWSYAARGWWKRVCSLADGNAATRARLRRCHDRTDAFMVPAALQLAKTLAPSNSSDEQLGSAIDLARVLAHIKVDKSIHPMRSVGWTAFPRDGAEGAERPKLGETRFRRLLQATDGEERVTAFVRLIALMDNEANVAEIADAFHWWSYPDGHVRQRWAFQYYNVNSVPTAVTTTPFEESVES